MPIPSEKRSPPQGSIEPTSKAARRLFRDARRRQQAGQLAEAAQLYQEVLGIEPRHADSLHLLGVILLQSGWSQQAAGLIAQAVQLRGDVAHYHSNLGNALRELDRPEQAIACYQRALELAPAMAETHCNLATSFMHAGRLAEARASYQRALAIKPTLADAHAGLAVIHQHQGDARAAAAAYEQAAALDPRRAHVHNNLGFAYHVLGQYDRALSCYQRALELDPGLADACNNMGFTLQARGDSEPAIACFERALELDPRFAVAANNLGNALKECGRFDAALASYDRALALQPDYAAAHFNRADTKTFRAGDPELKALEELADSSERLPVADAPMAHFALAKALDDIGEVDRAFAQLLLANRLRRNQLSYDEPAVDDYFGRLPATFDREFLEACGRGGDPSGLPVFIIGMPRSGSTLVEQILASHPQVQSAGERNALEQVAFEILGEVSAAAYPEAILEADPEVLRRIGRSYLERLPALSPGRTRVIDKLPGNFVHVGLIRAVLPQARMIHVTRDALDTCLSCFSKHFQQGQEFSYELAELGRHYRRYRQLMQHWHARVPGSILSEVSYEQLVAKLEAEARRLVEFCGLAWDDRCLEFHRGTRVVTTASAVQVRRPLFASSVNRSRRYAAHLAPLIAALEA